MSRKAKLRYAEPLTPKQLDCLKSIISKAVLRKYFDRKIADTLLDKFLGDKVEDILSFISDNMSKSNINDTALTGTGNQSNLHSDLVTDPNYLNQNVLPTEVLPKSHDNPKYVSGTPNSGSAKTPLKSLLSHFFGSRNKNAHRSSTLLNVLELFKQAYDDKTGLFYDPLISYLESFQVFDLVRSISSDRFYSMYNVDSRDVSKSKSMWETECKNYPDTEKILKKAFITLFYLEKETYELTRICLFRLMDTQTLRVLMDTMLKRVVNTISSLSPFIDDDSDTRRYFYKEILHGLCLVC